MRCSQRVSVSAEPPSVRRCLHQTCPWNAVGLGMGTARVGRGRHRRGADSVVTTSPDRSVRTVVSPGRSVRRAPTVKTR
ncbi:hypothetical protein ANCCAN_28030 [Ancylostoma caninum]|uniref:Uncharacterized protein n=1 Tax=Ancylostoma caninum TaxID=29170 RepID=A0A368F2A7_ANCCA|nr:hypothetical protein ANCCAN_28030 [Ancylostoma caninum]